METSTTAAIGVLFMAIIQTAGVAYFWGKISASLSDLKSWVKGIDSRLSAIEKRGGAL